MKRCPQCSHNNIHYSSKPTYDGKFKRYYKCLKCGVRYITYYEFKEIILKINGKEVL
jgi:transcriptional regulator NrdR family protein